MMGGCQCGAVRYSIEGEVLRSALCACNDCRRSSGAPAIAWALVPRASVVFDGEVSTYNSSGDVQRGFCARCGTGLSFESTTRLPGLINIRSATLDDPSAVAPGAWVQMADAPDWLHDIGGLPKFQRYSRK